MIAEAPGKLVLSGAYAVLHGAPALVAAVDRQVRADGSRPAERVTEEVAAALAMGHLGRAPWFDASALRTEGDGGGRKLGLGSSAAILVASMAAVGGRVGEADRALGERLLRSALAAHHRAQAGGSGVDVAAACLGGVLCCRLQGASGDDGGTGPLLACTPHPLPDDLVVAAFACPQAASTRQMLARVVAFAQAKPEQHRALMDALGGAAEQAAAAARLPALLGAMDRQHRVLAALGAAAGAAIVTERVAALAEAARAEGACFGPAGAGGGDVAVWFGASAPDGGFRARARAMGLWPMRLRLGVPGVHLVSD